MLNDIIKFLNIYADQCWGYQLSLINIINYHFDTIYQNEKYSNLTFFVDASLKKIILNYKVLVSSYDEVPEEVKNKIQDGIDYCTGLLVVDKLVK